MDQEAILPKTDYATIRGFSGWRTRDNTETRSIGYTTKSGHNLTHWREDSREYTERFQRLYNNKKVTRRDTTEEKLATMQRADPEQKRERNGGLRVVPIIFKQSRNRIVKHKSKKKLNNETRTATKN